MIDRQRLESILREAGDLAMGLWPPAGQPGPEGHILEVHEKSPGNPVSEADMAVDAFLRRELASLLPAAGWLSEETADNPAQRAGDLVWLVDPIDGTRDFIHGRKGWAVSVALVRSGRPLLAMLCAPARGEFWQAEAGHGAFCNGARLQASTRAQLAGARIPAKALAQGDADLVLVEQPNSIALRMAMVAANKADLLVSLRWGYEWDIAAAALIAREAGAAVSDALGAKLDFNKHDPRNFGVLVCPPAMQSAALARLADRAAKLA